MKKRLFSAAALAALISSTALGCAEQATLSSPDAGSAADDQTATGWVDGSYAGDSVQTRFGAVQVQAIIEDAALADVRFVSYPTGHESSDINSEAAPLLIQEAIKAQSAEVDAVTGATITSQAFTESLQSALTKADG
jgi:uncharacterized protein with FMN-binding domain